MYSKPRIADITKEKRVFLSTQAIPVLRFGKKSFVHAGGRHKLLPLNVEHLFHGEVAFTLGGPRLTDESELVYIGSRSGLYDAQELPKLHIALFTHFSNLYKVCMLPFLTLYSLLFYLCVLLFCFLPGYF